MKRTVIFAHLLAASIAAAGCGNDSPMGPLDQGHPSPAADQGRPSQPDMGTPAPKQEPLVNGDFSRGDFSGWSRSGDSFALFAGSDGQPRMTTYGWWAGNTGGAAVGSMWQDFRIETATELRFAIHGGHSAIKLLDGAQVIQEVRGCDSNDQEIFVSWPLSAFLGKTLRLLIEDKETDNWGFIGSTGFELR